MKKNRDEKETVVVGPNFLAHWFIYDFEVCVGVEGLKQIMDDINYHGYDLISVTQSGEIYTVFFRRRACG